MRDVENPALQLGGTGLMDTGTGVVVDRAEALFEQGVCQLNQGLVPALLDALLPAFGPQLLGNVVHLVFLRCIAFRVQALPLFIKGGVVPDELIVLESFFGIGFKGQKTLQRPATGIDLFLQGMVAHAGQGEAGDEIVAVEM